MVAYVNAMVLLLNVQTRRNIRFCAFERVDYIFILIINIYIYIYTYTNNRIYNMQFGAVKHHRTTLAFIKNESRNIL